MFCNGVGGGGGGGLFRGRGIGFFGFVFFGFVLFEDFVCVGFGFFIVLIGLVFFGYFVVFVFWWGWKFFGYRN